MLGPLRAISLRLGHRGNFDRSLVGRFPVLRPERELLGRVLDLLDLRHEYPDVRLSVVKVSFLRWPVSFLNLLPADIRLQLPPQNLQALPLLIDVVVDVVHRRNVRGDVLLVVGAHRVVEVEVLELIGLSHS